MCRKEAYQTRVVHEGVTHLRGKMAITYVLSAVDQWRCAVR